MKTGTFRQKTFEEKMAIKKKADERAMTRAKERQKTLTVKKPKKKKSTKPKKKKNSISSFEGIRNTKRWVGWKGMYWTIFSMYTRKRDFIKYGGRCVCCGEITDHWRNWDAGHYVSVSNGNAETCFNEKNVHGQCKRCNNPKWTPDASIPFREELIKRIGVKEVLKLEKIRREKKAGKEPTQNEYEMLCGVYKSKYEKL